MTPAKAGGNPPLAGVDLAECPPERPPPVLCQGQAWRVGVLRFPPYIVATDDRLPLR